MKLSLPCLAIVSTLFFSGCATQSISHEKLNQYKTIQQQLKTNSAAIIADGCLFRRELGTSHVVGFASRNIANTLDTQLRQALKNNDVAVTASVQPFVCGFLPSEQLSKYDIKQEYKGKREPIPTHGLVNAESQVSGIQSTAIKHLYQSFNHLQTQNRKDFKNQTNILDFSAQDQETLKTFAQSNYLFIISAVGTDVSFGRSFTTGAVSLGISAVTLGAGTFLIPQESQNYTVSLIDLNTKEILNTSGGILPKEVYAQKGMNNPSSLSSQIVYPLFDKKP